MASPPALHSLSFDAASHDPSSARSNVDTPPHESKLRKLRLRKARFQGAHVPSNQQLSSSSPPPSANHSSLASSSPTPHMRSPRRPSSSMAGGANALQELSNASLRRKKTQSRDITVFAEPESPLADENATSPNLQQDKHRRSSIPVKVSRPHGTRLSTSSRRSISGGDSKYIEHLESQLAAMQTQLHSLTSPSSTRTQSAKLRAMNSEAKLLRQEIADWEHKFNERLREQMEQNDIVTSSLRTHIRALERTAEEDRARLSDLLAASEAKSRSLEAVESANYELERRVEFLSDLLATSPNKVDLHTSDGDSRPLRPRSIPPTRLFSPERAQRRSNPANSFSTPGSQARRRDSHASQSSYSSLDRAASSAARSETAASLHSQLDESDEPESPTVLESNHPSSRRYSWMKPKPADAQNSSRPTRKMRRFYTGAMGPRALILPATTYAGSLPTSAHTPSTPCPLPGHGFNRHSLSDFQIPLSFPATSDIPRAHRRSATWDQDDTLARLRRQTIPYPISTSLPPIPQAQAEPAQLHEASHTDEKRIVSTAPTLSKSLFDEIGHMRFDSSSDFGGSLPGTAVKHRGSPSDSSSSDSRPPSPSELNEKSSKTAPDQEINQLTLFAKSPHSDSDPASVYANPNGTPLATLVRRPGVAFALLSSLFSRSLHLYTSSARHVFGSAWSSTTLSRPVIEFRWWLVRILIGGMRRKGMLHDRNKHSQRSMSAGLGLGLASKQMLPSSPPETLGRADSGALLLSGDPGPSSLTAAPLSVGDHLRTKSTSKGHHGSSSGPVTTWVRFSVTLLFAVGMAIKDGPGSLLGDDVSIGDGSDKEVAADDEDDDDDDDDWLDDLDDEGVDGWQKTVLSRGLR